MKKIAVLILAVVMLAMCFAGCSNGKETVVIYSCANDQRIAFMTESLQAKFPDYNIVVEYMGTSKLAAKLLAEGANTDCDIVHDLSYLNLDSLNNANILADLSYMDTSAYLEDTLVSKNYIVECRTAGGIIVNKDVLTKLNLPAPTSYEDLLKPEYKGLISMPDPKASGTGYMFFKSLVNVWGEQKAVDYFTKLSVNVLQFTSSGNGPVNALMQQEVAIGLGMTNNAVLQIDSGANLEILFFEEGAPVSMYGQTIIAGKETKDAVKAVFDYMVNEHPHREGEKFGMEKIFKDKEYTSKNYPTNIKYADMSNDTLTEKERLLALWNIT